MVVISFWSVLVGEQRLGGGFGAEQPRGEWGEPPVPAAEQGNDRRQQQRADNRGVEQDAGAEAGGEDLDAGAGRRRHRYEAEEEDQRGAGDEPAGAADAFDDGGVG